MITNVKLMSEVAPMSVVAAQLGQKRLDRRIRRHLVARRRQLEEDTREGRAKPIVEIAPEPPPFLLPRRDQSLARALEIEREARGVDHRANLPRQIVK